MPFDSPAQMRAARRRTSPLALAAALALIGSCAAACASTVNGTPTPVGNVGNHSTPNKGFPSVSSSGPVSSPTIAPPPSTHTSSGGGGSHPGSGSGSSSVSAGGSDAAFCAVFKKDFSKIQGAGSNPQGALDAFDEIVATAPAAIKSDAEYVDNALHQALSGQAPSNTTKLAQATEHVVEYAGQHCPNFP